MRFRRGLIEHDCPCSYISSHTGIGERAAGALFPFVVSNKRCRYWCGKSFSFLCHLRSQLSPGSSQRSVNIQFGPGKRRPVLLAGEASPLELGVGVGSFPAIFFAAKESVSVQERARCALRAAFSSTSLSSIPTRCQKVFFFYFGNLLSNSLSKWSQGHGGRREVRDGEKRG